MSKIIMGPASQPELKIDAQHFFAELEAKFRDCGFYGTQVDEQGTRWYDWEIRTQRGNLQGRIAEDTAGSLVFFEGQGADEEAFIFWLRSFMPRDQRLFLHDWDGACFLEITEDTTPQMLMDGYNDIPSGDVDLAVNCRVWANAGNDVPAE